MRRIFLALCLSMAVLTLNTGCAKKVPIHPGALNTFDSYAYDTLLASQSVIEDAKAKFAANPANKAVLNQAIAAYNAAESSYKLYHAASSDPQALANFQQALDDLVKAVVQIKQAFNLTNYTHDPDATQARTQAVS